MIIYRLNQSEMKKCIELCVLDVKIGPFSRILDVETSLPTWRRQNRLISCMETHSPPLSSEKEEGHKEEKGGLVCCLAKKRQNHEILVISVNNLLI